MKKRILEDWEFIEKSDFFRQLDKELKKRILEDWEFIEKSDFFQQLDKEDVCKYLYELIDDVLNKKYDRAIERSEKINRIVVKTLLNDYKISFSQDDTSEWRIKKLKDFANQSNNKELLDIINYFIFYIKNIRNAYEHENTRIISNEGKNDCLFVLDKLHKLLQKVCKTNSLTEIDFSIYFVIKDKNKINVVEKVSGNEQSNVDIVIEKRNIEDWLTRKDEKIIIPIYQRKYSWDEKDLEILVLDIIKRMEDDKDHYFGTIAAKKDGNNIKVIDGQQRLTTSLLLMYAVRDLLIEQGEERSSIFPYIFQTDFLKNPTFDSSNDTIFEDIKKMKFTYENSETNINNVFYKNYRFLKGIVAHFTNYKISKLYKFANTYIKKFQLSTISFDEEIYTNKMELEIFENLNSKGKSLNSYELIRNYIFNLCSKEIYDDFSKLNLIRGEYKFYIDEKFKDDKTGIDFFKLLINYITGEEISTTRQFTLYDKVKEFLPQYFDIKNEGNLNKEEISKIIKKISDYLQIYNYIKECGKSSKNDFNVFFNEYLSNEGRIKYLLKSNFQSKKRELFLPLSFLLFEILDFNCDSDNNFQLSSQDFKNIYQSYELILHFTIRTSLASGNSSDSRIKRYTFEKFKHIREKIISSKDEKIEIKLSILKNLIKKYFSEEVDKFWPFFEFKNNLVQPLSKEVSKTILRILENKLSNSEKTGEQLSIQNESLEHIMPENSEKWWIEYSDNSNELSRQEWEEKYKNNLNKLGNLLLLSQKLNSGLRNEIFSIKNQKYQNLKISLYKNSNPDFDISKRTKWDFDDIERRTEKLAKYFYENIIKE